MQNLRSSARRARTSSLPPPFSMAASPQLPPGLLPPLALFALSLAVAAGCKSAERLALLVGMGAAGRGGLALISRVGGVLRAVAAEGGGPVVTAFRAGN
jgi:hypothetical protein